MPKECPMCKKPWDRHKKPQTSPSTAKVGGKEVKTLVMTAFSCDEKEIGRFTYSTEIPGWFVDLGSMKVVEFEVKK